MNRCSLFIDNYRVEDLNNHSMPTTLFSKLANIPNDKARDLKKTPQNVAGAFFSWGSIASLCFRHFPYIFNKHAMILLSGKYYHSKTKIIKKIRII